MVKDVVVNLSVLEGRDPACDYALSVAHAFNAHLAGIAFAYDPVLAIAGEAMPPKWIEEQHAKAAEAADAAVAKFEEGARRVGLSAELRVLNATVGEGPELFGQIARRFDLSIVQQNNPERPANEDLVIEAALFDSGRPVLIVPYIQTEKSQSQSCASLLGRKPQRRPRHRRFAAVSFTRKGDRSGDHWDRHQKQRNSRR